MQQFASKLLVRKGEKWCVMVLNLGLISCVKKRRRCRLGRLGAQTGKDVSAVALSRNETIFIHAQIYVDKQSTGSLGSGVQAIHGTKTLGSNF